MKKALLKEIAKVEMTKKESLDMKLCAYVELLDTIKESISIIKAIREFEKYSNFQVLKMVNFDLGF